MLWPGGGRHSPSLPWGRRRNTVLGTVTVIAGVAAAWLTLHIVALLLLGIISFATMEVTDSPDIDFPAATVTVIQPGAAPEEMENQITQRVEAALRGVEGVDEINSSINEGRSNTFVQFAIGTPTDRAVNDVREAIAHREQERDADQRHERQCPRHARRRHADPLPPDPVCHHRASRRRPGCRRM